MDEAGKTKIDRDMKALVTWIVIAMTIGILFMGLNALVKMEDERMSMEWDYDMVNVTAEIPEDTWELRLTFHNTSTYKVTVRAFDGEWEGIESKTFYNVSKDKVAVMRLDDVMEEAMHLEITIEDLRAEKLERIIWR